MTGSSLVKTKTTLIMCHEKSIGNRLYRICRSAKSAVPFYNELEERKTNYGIGLDELIMRVTGDIGIDMEDLLSSKREQKISYARAIISYLAAVKLGYNGTSLAKVLRMSRKSVSRSIKRGKKILDNNPKMLEYLI